MSTLVNGEKKFKAHLLMIALVFAWGFDYVPVKYCLREMTPIQFLFCKYLVGFICIIIIKIVQGNKNFIRKKDIPFFIVCSLFGEITYFSCEYEALSYIPVSLDTIVLALVPAFSIIIERIFQKKKPNKLMVIGVATCMIGIILVIGADFNVLLTGRGIGYLLSFCAVIAWNIYNFVTAWLEEYDSITLAFAQMLCTLLLMTPYILYNPPAFLDLANVTYVSLAYTGVIDAGIGFVIVIYGLQNLGPTISAVYSNFLPVTSTIFGWFLLHENITILQILGGIIVIGSGFVVIKEKGKLDENYTLNNSKAKDNK